VDRDPLPIATLKHDPLPLVERDVTLFRDDLRAHEMGENRDVTEQLHSLVAAHARAHPEPEVPPPRSPFLLICLATFEAFRRGVEDERRAGWKSSKYASGSSRLNAAIIALEASITLAACAFASAAGQCPDHRPSSGKGLPRTWNHGCGRCRTAPNDMRISCGPSCPRPQKPTLPQWHSPEGAARAAPFAGPARRPHARLGRTEGDGQPIA
jgi:hypothetical protein